MKKIYGIKALIVLIVLIMLMLGVKLAMLYKDAKDKTEYEGPDTMVFTTRPDEISEEMVDEEIIKHNKSAYLTEENDFPVEVNELLGAQKPDDKTIILYLMVMYKSFAAADNFLSGGVGCVAMTFEKNGGGWEMAEYWEPLDGSLYKSSIEKKIPPEISENAVDTQKYVKKLQKEIQEKVDEHFGVSSETDSTL